MSGRKDKATVFEKGRQGSALVVCARGNILITTKVLVGWKRLLWRPMAQANACLLPSCGASLLG
jgi:hypothetical protein